MIRYCTLEEMPPVVAPPLMTACPREFCRGQLWPDESGGRKCSFCGRADRAIIPLPLVSEIVLLVEPPDALSRAAALEGRTVTPAERKVARRRAREAAASMRYRDRVRAAKAAQR